MARQKRNSCVLGKAEIRLASIKSISPTLDVGEGLTVDDYTGKIESLRKSLEAYNTTLSTIDVLLPFLRRATAVFSQKERLVPQGGIQNSK